MAPSIQPLVDLSADVSHFNHPVDLSKLIPVANIYKAYKKMKSVITRTPVQKSMKLSE